jgi:hypothetical protein
MTETVRPSGISFWQQDLHWYVRQQSWTRSFYEADRNWTAELSGGSPPGSAANAARLAQLAGSASIAKQDPLDPAHARIEAASPGTPGGLSNATGGAVLDILA